uniref:Uncharacterized protein n=1 Tax=Geobacter metallireducens TaxID=28232 RepID=A0A831UEE7_GEOME
MKATSGVSKRCKLEPLLLCLVFLAALAVGIGPVQAGPPPAPLGGASGEPGVPADLIPEVPDPDGFVIVNEGDYFSCGIPPGWTRIDNYGYGLSNEEKKTYGFDLRAPDSGEFPVSISIFYYAEGNVMYKSVEHYVTIFSCSGREKEGDGNDYCKIRPMTVSGREGMVFESHSVRSVPRPPSGPPPRGVYIRPGLDAKTVLIRQRFVVLLAKQGFYALRYTASKKEFQQFLPVFEKVTQRFYARW